MSNELRSILSERRLGLILKYWRGEFWEIKKKEQVM
jgi:hypothetical protein